MRRYIGFGLLCAGVIAMNSTFATAGTQVFPGVASVTGENATAWRSEVFLHNRGTSPQDVVLEIIPRGGSTVVAAHTYPLAAGESLVISDLYAALGAPSGAGTLVITGNTLAWVRTYNQGASGTFGQAIPAADTTRCEPGQTLVLPTHTPASIATEPRSNLILVSLDAMPQTLTLRLATTTKTVEIPPGVYMQIGNAGQWIGGPAGDGVLAITSTGVWGGYVSTVDPSTGDPTTVAGEVVFEYPLYDPFDTLGGWTYAPNSTLGASFRSTGGLLSVSSYGEASAGNGPVVTKALDQPVNPTTQDFVLDTYVVTPGGSAGSLIMTVELLDADGTPLVGARWDPDGLTLNLLWEGTEDSDWDSSYKSLTGKLSVACIDGRYSLSFNDGAPIVTGSATLNRLLSAARISFQRKLNYFDPGDVKLDWVRVGLR